MRSQGSGFQIILRMAEAVFDRKFGANRSGVDVDSRVSEVLSRQNHFFFFR